MQISPIADNSSEMNPTLLGVAAVGAVMLGFRIFDGLTDIVAGAFSDIWVRKGRTRQSLLWHAFLLPSLGLVLFNWLVTRLAGH